MRDADIRRVLDRQLRQSYQTDSDVVIRHELGICAGQARVDLAVLAGTIDGWEIKSDVDTLSRLSGQAAAFGLVLDHMTVVTTDRYLEAASRLVPTWWGLVLAGWDRDEARLETQRKAIQNRGVDPAALAQLLWRDEAMDELRTRGVAAGLSKQPRHYVWQRLAAELELAELRQVVRDRLKARQLWPGGQLQRPRDGSFRTHANL